MTDWKIMSTHTTIEAGGRSARIDILRDDAGNQYYWLVRVESGSPDSMRCYSSSASTLGAAKSAATRRAKKVLKEMSR